MRGSTPLDVAAASVMDNYELALALTEPDLEKVRTTGVFCLSLIAWKYFVKRKHVQHDKVLTSSSWHELKTANALLNYSRTM